MSPRAWWAFAVMSVTWGASYLLIKIGIDGGIPAPDVAWLRVALAAAILMGLAWRAGTLRTLAGRWRWVWAYAVAEISIPFPLIAAGAVDTAISSRSPGRAGRLTAVRARLDRSKYGRPAVRLTYGPKKNRGTHIFGQNCGTYWVKRILRRPRKRL